MEDDIKPTEQEQLEELEVTPTGSESEAQDPVVEEEEQEISQDPVELPQEDVEPPVSPRESKRIKQLLEKWAQNDEARYRQAPPRRESRGNQIIPEGEYDIEEINDRAARFGDAMFERGLSQAQLLNNANTFATRLEIDAPRVNSKYAFLDSESKDFNPSVASFVNRMYLNSVGYDPRTGVPQDLDLRYPDFVEGFMEALELVSVGRQADTTRNVTEQVARAGIRPGGSGKTIYRGTDPKKMSDEQLDAAIAQGLR